MAYPLTLHFSNWDYDETPDRTPIPTTNDTESFKNVLGAAFPELPLSGWKRTGKYQPITTKYWIHVFRTFKHTSGIHAVVVPCKDFRPPNCPDGFKEDPVSEFRVYTGEYPKPQKGMFPLPLPTSDDDKLTGRTCFSVDPEDCGDDGCVQMFCAAEKEEDHNGCSYSEYTDRRTEGFLTKLFKDKDIDVSCAEGIHMINPTEGESWEELAALVRARMIKAGAIEIPSFEEED